MTARRRALCVAVPALTLAVTAFLTVGPVRLEWKVRHGKSLLQLGDAQAALEAFLEAEKLAPDEARVQFLIARSYRRLGQSAAVFERIHRAHALGYDPAALEREWILAQAQGGLLNEAEPHLASLLTSPGDDGPEICAAFVAGYVLNYRFDQAEVMLEAWERDFPDDPEPHMMRGRIQRRWENLREAEREFRAALALKPGYFGAAEQLARVLVDLHRYEEAAVIIEPIFAAGTGSDAVKLAWAECLLQLDRGSEAAAVLADVAARSPDSCDALLGLGNADLWSDRPDQAIEHFDKALKLCPRRPDIRYARALALARSGDHQTAQREFETVNTVQAALTRAYDLAAKLLREPANVESRLEIGRTLIEYGDPVEGAKWVATILEYDPQNEQAHSLLADYYAKTGDAERASRHKDALSHDRNPSQ